MVSRERGNQLGRDAWAPSTNAGRRESGVRLADLVAAFSLATDRGLGQPMEHVLRSWLIAAELQRLLTRQLRLPHRRSP
jgi:hypothetical protein